MTTLFTSKEKKNAVVQSQRSGKGIALKARSEPQNKDNLVQMQKKPEQDKSKVKKQTASELTHFIAYCMKMYPDVDKAMEPAKGNISDKTKLSQMNAVKNTIEAYLIAIIHVQSIGALEMGKKRLWVNNLTVELWKYFEKVQIKGEPKLTVNEMKLLISYMSETIQKNAQKVQDAYKRLNPKRNIRDILKNLYQVKHTGGMIRNINSVYELLNNPGFFEEKINKVKHWATENKNDGFVRDLEKVEAFWEQMKRNNKKIKDLQRNPGVGKRTPQSSMKDAANKIKIINLQNQIKKDWRTIMEYIRKIYSFISGELQSVNKEINSIVKPDPRSNKIVNDLLNKTAPK